MDVFFYVLCLDLMRGRDLFTFQPFQEMVIPTLPVSNVIAKLLFSFSSDMRVLSSLRNFFFFNHVFASLYLALIVPFLIINIKYDYMKLTSLAFRTSNLLLFQLIKQGGSSWRHNDTFLYGMIGKHLSI